MGVALSRRGRNAIVAMSLRALLIVVVVGQAAAASDVEVDWSTLTDFTVDFEADGRNARMAPPQARDFSAHGTIHADVFGERIRITSSSHATVMTPFLPAPFQGEGIDHNYEFVFDGPGGFASVTGKVHLDATDSVYCMRVNFPKGFFPPPEALRAMISNAEPQMEDALNKPPHMESTFDGEKVFVYQGPQGFAGIQHNGFPVFLSDHGPTSTGTWEPTIKFSKLAQGAGEIGEPHCMATSVSELLANPETAKALDGFDQVMTALKSMTSLQQAFAHFPQQPSLIFTSAAMIELNTAKAGANIAVQPVASSFMVAVAGVVGALSAAATMAIVLMMSKSFARSSGRIALISDDA